MELSGEYTFDGPRETVWAYLQDPNILTKVLPGCDELKEIGENEYQGAIKIKIGPIQGKFQGTIHLTNIVPPEGYDIDISGQGAPGFVKGGGGLRLEAQDDKTHMTYQGQAQIGGRIANVGQRLIESSAKAIIRQSLDELNRLIVLLDAPESVTEPEETPLPPTEEAPLSPAPSSEKEGGAAAAELPLPPAPSPEREWGAASVATVASAEAGASPLPSRVGVNPAPVIPSRYTAPSQSQMALQVAADVTRDLIPAPLLPVVGGAAGGALVLIIYLILKQVFGSKD